MHTPRTTSLPLAKALFSTSFWRCFAWVFLMVLALPGFAVPPDLTAGGVPSSAININLGPTGLRGWVYHQSVNTGESRQIQVQAVDVGSPGAAGFAVGDVILGADGTGAEPVNFSADARRSLANAINDAEALNPATLKLLRWRAGVTTTVTLTLRTMGAYTATAPYTCPKSAQILEEGLQAIMVGETAGSYSFGTLSLLAGNNPGNPLNAARQTRAQTEARALIPNAATLAALAAGDPFSNGSSSWHRGHELVVLTEYYLQTGDALVLPAIDAISKCIIGGSNVFGTTGHGYAPKWRDGSPNGPLRQGYGAVNSASMPGFLGLLLTKECGVVNANLDPAIARSSRFFAYYAGKGAVPYGEHEAYWQGHSGNGKCGLAALSFELQPGRAAEQKFYARMSTASTSERELGHTGAFFNYLWEPLGAAAGGEAAAASFFSRTRWMFDLCRRWDGSFVYDNLNGEGPDSGATYHDFKMSTAALLVYSLPLRQIHITGRGHDPLRWMTPAELADSVAVDGYKAATRTTGELVADLGSWSPLVQRRAAEELGERPTETTALLPALHAMANDLPGTSRVGACFALGYIGHASSGPVIAALLTDSVNHVRFAAAEAMRYLPNNVRLAHLSTILSATASTATPLLPFNEEDPLHFAHGRLGTLLFYNGSAYGPSGVLASSIAGVDRSLLYPAIRAVAANPVGFTRSTLGYTYNNLTPGDFLALADTVVQSAYDLTPADKMFSGGDRKAALNILEIYNAAEGVPLSVLTIQDAVGFNAEALAVLTNYAGSSLTVRPDAGVEAAMNFLIQTNTNVAEAQAMLAAIAGDPNPATLVPLKNIQSAIADSSSLNLPSQWTTLRVTSHDYAKGDSVYTWRKIHGAGNVSFAPNGTSAAKTTTVFFDGTPGQYLFEVKMADSKNLTEVFSTVTVTLYNSGGTLPPNNPPTANAQSPTIPQATPTPIVLTGSDSEGYALNFSVTSQPAHGALTGTAPFLTYTPDFGYTGADSFNFQVQDSEGQTASAAVSINVAAGSGVPVAIYEPFDYTTGILNGKTGSTEVGFGGAWFGTSANALIMSSSLAHGSLPVAGNSFGCNSAVNHFGGSRTVSASALAANGLLNNGATLWFSAVVGYGSGANLTNSRLGFALANHRFSTNNYAYYISNDGPQLGSGLGLTLGRFDSANGYVVATQFRDSTFGASGFAGNVFGNVPPSFIGDVEHRLVVGKITWGAASDTIELYEPDEDLNLGAPTSTLTVNVDQSTYDTITFAMGERVTLDEIRFGENYTSVLAGNIAMVADTTPPTPNPTSFATAPTVIPGNAITMTAATAYDSNGVEYFFTCTAGGGDDSGWQSSATYTDSGLTPGVLYGYTVKTRDLSPARNESSPSTAASATIFTVVTVPVAQGMMQTSAQQILADFGLTVGTVQTMLSDTVPVGHLISQSPSGGQSVALGSVVNLVVSAGETTPPAPNPAAFSSAPVVVGNNSITMTAALATDLNGVEYYFTCTAGGGHDSGWQTSRTYTDTGLTPGALYSYTVTVRDLAPQQNTTAPSAPASVNAPGLGYFWDGGSADILTAGNGASGGTAGTWNTALLNWDIGTAPHRTWNNASNETAVFGGTAGTVTLGENIASGGLRFSTTGYTIDAGANTLSFGAGSGSVVLNGSSFSTTITGAVAGAGNVTFTSGAANGPSAMNTLNLGGTSTGGWSGASTVGRGIILSLSGTNQALLSTSGITLNGGQITLTNTSPTAVSNNRISGTVPFNSNGGTLTILNTAGAGNIYSETIGDVNINAGFTSIFAPTSQSGVSGNKQTIVMNSLNHSGYGVVAFGAGGTLNSNTFFQITTGSAATAANKIIGPWAIIGNTATQGDWAIYNGSGAISARGSANTAETSWTAAWADTANYVSNINVTLSANREVNTLRYTSGTILDVGDKTLATYGVMNGSSGTVTIQAVTSGGTGYLTIPDDNGSQPLYLQGSNRSLVVSAPIKDNGANVLTLVAVPGHNGNTLTLSGNNTHTGGTVISAPGTRNAASTDPGAVLIGNVNALGANTNFLQADSGTLNLQGNAITIGKLDGLNGTITGTATLTLGNGDATGGNFQGNLTGTLELTKLGTGTQTLSGINTYSGVTMLNNGTLWINGSLTNAANDVAVNGGALGGTGSIAGSVTLAAAGSIAPGAAGAGTISIGESLDVTAPASGGSGKLRFDLAALAASDKIAITGNLTIGSDVLGFSDFVFTNLGGLQNGKYTLITSGSISIGDYLDAADLSGAIGGGGFGALQISGNNIELVVSGIIGPLDHFAITAISSPRTVGVPITGITIIAQDVANQTVPGFIGTVTFGGTGGFSGTSASFTAGILSNVSVTPTVVGSGLTFTVTDGVSGKVGTTTIATIQTQFQSWSGGAAFDADSDGDGVANGLAWVLGTANPSQNASGILPAINNSDPDYFIYTYRRRDDANNSANITIAAQYTATLTGWTAAVHDGNNVIITTTNDFYGASPGVDKVEVKLKRSTLAPSGQIFVRLRAQLSP